MMDSTIFKRINLVFQVLFGLVLAYVFVRLAYYHYQLVTFPYPLEYREGSMIMAVEAMLKGLNPFAIENQPRYTNVYGIVYSLVVYPFAKIWGPTTYVHRAVTAFFAFLCCGVLARVMHRKKVPLLLNLSGVLIFYAFLLFPRTTTPCAGPNTLGLFLFLVALFLPWKHQYSWKSLWASILISLVAFYTKPYFVFALPYLTFFLFFFVSKKKGIIYGFVSLFLLTGSIVVMNHYFDAYFNNIIFVHTNATNDFLVFCHEQFVRFFKYHSGLFLILFGILGVSAFQGIRKVCREGNVFSDVKQKIRHAVNFSGFRKPFLNSPGDLALFCMLFSTAVLYFRLGRNNGAWMWYFFHLLTPFVILVVCGLMKKYERWQLLFLPFLIFNLLFVSYEHDLGAYLRENDFDLKGWESVTEQIKTYKNVLNSPFIAPLLVHEGMPVYDSGLTEYFKMGAYRHSMSWLFPKDGRVTYRHYKYRDEIKEMIKAKKFDLAFVTYRGSNFIPQMLPKYYRQIGGIKLPAPHLKHYYKMSIWLPK
ncbi:MAG: hypothetical protein KAJ18_02255 [Candidatus Omnitrophica bacterium]|nr:hypothetical protein [Candidatus Omnitrophota bacterium]